ncbi:hypothetical protein RB195_018866 [Necator americanus]|uniref:Uncharacterized protein n=1 Tax=Necator americanus TaxID=51031 RepID=A0ABR1CDQ3_NECAM
MPLCHRFEESLIEAVMEALDNKSVSTPHINILRQLYIDFTTKISPPYNDIMMEVKRGRQSGGTVSEVNETRKARSSSEPRQDDDYEERKANVSALSPSSEPGKEKKRSFNMPRFKDRGTWAILREHKGLCRLHTSFANFTGKVCSLKIRSSCDNHRGQKISRRSRPRSPLPDNVDISTPLSSLASDHEALVTAAVNFVGWNGVVPMLPPCLQGRSRNDVILLVSDELDGMSEKRIFRILQGFHC